MARERILFKNEMVSRQNKRDKAAVGISSYEGRRYK